MDTPRFNDAVLNHILGTLNGRIGGILQEQQTQVQNMHAEFNQWASQQQEQEQQLRALLAKEVERANELQRWVDFIIADGYSDKGVVVLRERFQAAEQRKQDNITAAIAPVTPDHTCTNCFTDTGPCTGQCAATAEPARVDPVEAEPKLVPEIDLPDDKHSLID